MTPSAGASKILRVFPIADGLRRPDPLPVEDLLFDSPLLRIGRFRCAPSHPLFTNSGPIINAVFAFPRSSVWIQHEGGTPFVADRTVATLYNRGQRYQRRALNGLEDESDWFAIAPGVLHELAAARDGHEPDREDVFRSERVPVESETYLHQRLLIDALLGGRADPLFVEEHAIWLAARITSRDVAEPGPPPPAPARTRQRHREHAEHVRDILNARFAEPLSLSDLARLTGLSVFHLARMFRRHTGVTLHAYRQALRLRHSVDRLARPGADLTAIALDLGFSSHSHFTAAFHRAFGVTPSTLRRVPARRLVSTPQRFRGVEPF